MIKIVSSLLEITAVVLNLVFLFFLIKEKKICWIFGMAGSLCSIYLFYVTGLYSECILFSYYFFIGFYGYYLWNGKGNHHLEIMKLKFSTHCYAIFISVVLALILGFLFDNYTNAKKSYLDAFSTIFSFLASYLEAKKILGSWIYWILLNGVSIYLYLTHELFAYSFLAAIYFGISFYGYFNWKRKYINLDFI